MDVKAIIRMGSKLYEAKRSLEQDVSGSEQLLFEACNALKQLQAENEKLKKAIIEIKEIEDDWDNALPNCGMCYAVQEIAQQALKGEE
jgi:uncharacterized protein Yka (UPF0111/DUF47 family)